MSKRADAASPNWRPNRRPSDYESDPNLPTGPARHHPGCSGAGPISSRAVQWCLVPAPGLPERLPSACVGAGCLPRIVRFDHAIAIGRFSAPTGHLHGHTTLQAKLPHHAQPHPLYQCAVDRCPERSPSHSVLKGPAVVTIQDPGWLVTGVAGGGSWPAATAATLALAGQLTALARMCQLCRAAGSKAPKQPLQLRSVLSAGCSLPLDPG